MADFMRDHVGLSEVTGCFETRPHLVIETEVDIGLLVGRTIKRPHCRLAHSARRSCRAGKKNERWRLITPPLRSEYLRPDIFGIRNNDRYHVCQRIIPEVIFRWLHTSR